MKSSEGKRTGSLAAAQEIVTGDMVSQFAYCPRRLHLMYAEGRWADNEYTEHGRFVHRNVDGQPGLLGAQSPDHDAPAPVRSVMLESPELGARATIDLVEFDSASGDAVPLEVKRSRLPPHGEPYPPERLQVALHAALLRANGFACREGLIYYAASRSRVCVPVDEVLMAEVEGAIAGVRDVLSSQMPPLPLVDSPKCVSCSLNTICLPDETHALRTLGRGGPSQGDKRDDAAPTDVRRLVAPRDDALPFYVQEPGAQVGKRSETLIVTRRKEPLAEVRLVDLSQLVLCGSVGISAAAVHLLCEAGVPIVHLSGGHWFYGVTRGHGLRNAFDRAAQFRQTANADFCLRIARAIVIAKGRNQRTLLRRNGRSHAPVLAHLRRAITAVEGHSSLDELLGAEGHIAALYFGAFASMLKTTVDGTWSFDFRVRNRRPPRDPINALLSFSYSLLLKDVTVALIAVGLDPYWGVYHRPRHGRPALALDLMEEVRATLADSAVITAVNTGAVARDDFVYGGGACALTPSGRRAFIRVYEARLDQEVKHPVFGYRLSWRRAIHLQAQLLARAFRGEIEHYAPLLIR